MILNEMVHDARVVPLTARPHTGLRQWLGEPRGRWEGNLGMVGILAGARQQESSK